MTGMSPRQRAEALRRRHPPLDDGAEHFVVYGVMGLPFTLGHILAFRRVTASSIGPPYTAVWHRDPAHRWTIYTDVAARISCPRYFGAAAARIVETRIELTWTAEDRIAIAAPAERLEWAVRVEPTPATWLLGAASRLVPRRLRSTARALAMAGPAVGRVLHAGPLALHGAAPNGQWFRLIPDRVWAVTASAAVVEGRDVGPIGPHARTARLGDFVLPARGIFAMGETVFETLDPDRHSRVHRASFRPLPRARPGLEVARPQS